MNGPIWARKQRKGTCQAWHHQVLGYTLSSQSTSRKALVKLRSCFARELLDLRKLAGSVWRRGGGALENLFREAFQNFAVG